MTNTNELRTFNFHGIELRILIKGREPWFMAVDAIDALGLRAKQGSSKQYLSGLDDDERFLVGRSMVEQVHISFPNRGATFISESGLYKLIMRSDKPEARKFQDWVTREVLPAIRKTGG
ncbi:BRO family protein [Shinella sp. AETb1-6]|uniref:BRO-N domain-containing protein n=1 Tax=Shinella sp. AETb1-6 TaxID=2692210 RepID=UPI00136C3CA0|nr:BRO family protein [Shinella sp. AETb1-6]MXN52002.1 BRO family protein [Shinella sp. AETb1-6]